MDGRNDLEKGSQPQGNKNVDLDGNPNRAIDEAPSVNGRLLDESGQNRNQDPQFRFLNFNATQDGTHELSEMSYKTSSEFRQALNSQDSQQVRFDPTDNCHQILIVTTPGHSDSPGKLAENFKTLEPYLQCRQASKESQRILREFMNWVVSMPLDDRQIESNFCIIWRRASPPSTRSLPAAVHCNGYAGEAIMPLVWQRDEKTLKNEKNHRIGYALNQSICCLCMSQTIILVHVEGYLHHWALSNSSDQVPPTESVTQSLVAGLRGFDRQTVSTPEVFRFVQRRICQITLEDQWEVLCCIDRMLRQFDSSMLYRFWLENSRIATWMLGDWRAYLHARVDFNLRLTGIIKAATNPGDKAEQDLRSAHSRLDIKAEGVLRHSESTFNASIGTISFVESTKAIQTGEQVKKLTQLAFCFIPLSFVCSMFSMNVTELARVSLWVWATTSASLLLTVYIVLYFGSIWNFIKLDSWFPKIRSFYRWHILWYITGWRPDYWPRDD